MAPSQAAETTAACFGNRPGAADGWPLLSGPPGFRHLVQRLGFLVGSSILPEKVSAFSSAAVAFESPGTWRE